MKLKRRPEKLGQELFGVFARAKLSSRGCAIGEAKSGIGFVDMLVTFSSGLVHVIEFKMLKSQDIPGPAQLETYMKHKQRKQGWLVFFDVRRSNAKRAVPSVINRKSRTIRTVVIEINPVAPSRQTEE